MKVLFISAVLIVVVLGTALAQQLTARTYLERTSVNLKSGYAVGFNFINDADAGVFFQKSAGFGNSPEKLTTSLHEGEFYGIYAAYPLLNRRVLDITYQVRTGMSNGQNFVITSSVLTDVTVMNRVKIGAGVGSRNFRPTLQSSITLVI